MTFAQRVKTDTLFYNLFQTFPSIFFELINQPPEQAATYEFTSREVKQLAFRLDGLFLPTLNEPDKPFYLLEVQFQPDEDLYYRLFAELFLYLKQYKPPHPWQVVVIYPTRSIEREQTLQFNELLTRSQRIYLDELGEAASGSLGVGVVKLVIENQQTAPERARRLIEQAQAQIAEETTRRNLIDLIETIIVYKLPQKSREEIEAMLGLNELKQTKVYQEAKQEGLEEGKLKAKLESIWRMIQLGLSSETIAEGLDLPLAVVQQAARSFHEQSIAAFIELLNRQRSLFSPQDLADLAALIEPLPDRTEDLSNTVAQWCKQEEHSVQLEAWRQILSGLLSVTVERLLETNPETLPTPSSPVDKAMLQNAIAPGESSI